MISQRRTHRRARWAALAVLASAMLALACTLTAAAEEVEEVGADSFDLNLAMEVSKTIDPDAPAHPVTVEIFGPSGEPVEKAEVAYAFVEPNPLYYVPPEEDEPVSVRSADPSASSGGMALSGEVVTGESGSARIEGIVRGCDYLVEVQAEGYRPYSGTHTCKGVGSETWYVVMEREDGSAAAGSGDSGGSTGWGDSFFTLPKLSATGDALLPWLLALSGIAFIGCALAVIVRRRSVKDGFDA